MTNGSWLLLGGGLANSLLALRLEHISAEYLIVERGSRLLGGQTWSCQLSDIGPQDRAFVADLTEAQWPDYVVNFPNFERVISSPYVTLRAESLRRKLEDRIPARKIRLNTDFSEIETGRFTHVIQAGGFAGAAAQCGFQKFLGWDLEFAKPHGISRPVLMDATVTQKDGYRFFYLLPFDPRTLLVEETRYSNDPSIDEADFAQGMNEYLFNRFQGHSWKRLREERGSLPIPWEMPPPNGKFGVEGGFFHPSSGYSLPSAVRASREILEQVRDGTSAAEALRTVSRQHAKDRSYFLMLNRMMFLASPPGERRKIFERFYRLNDNLIRRFYAGCPTTLDKVRMLSGKPPVKITDALKVLSRREERPVWK